MAAVLKRGPDGGFSSSSYVITAAADHRSEIGGIRNDRNSRVRCLGKVVLEIACFAPIHHYTLARDPPLAFTSVGGGSPTGRLS